MYTQLYCITNYLFILEKHTGLEDSASQSSSFELLNPIARYLVSSDQETLVGKSLPEALNNFVTLLLSEFQRYMFEPKATARMLFFPQSMMFA